ncbi:hypothetical protein [Halorussus aquaticus]|uniref:ArsR family transcriptional regulator n=1 Tax=Halorussus aquaticus TaxID=2953748 RepID=A0ABD5Q5E0_9EURY|nr:hypothetical protein [Halorussus aquaticus]
MELIAVSKALSNETRLRLLKLIAEEPGSATRLHQRYVDEYSDQKHRESIYRALETLVDAELLVKEYQKEAGLIYHLAHEQIVVELPTGDVTPLSTDVL